VIMVELIVVLDLYHEFSGLNSELETKKYWKYWRYFGRETTQILHDGYCSGVENVTTMSL
jgi:predicted nucleic acid-binding Zn finger protein